MAQFWCLKSKPEALLNHILTDYHSPNEFRFTNISILFKYNSQLNIIIVIFFRVKGMTQNSEFFQKAFNCKMPSQMCSVW